MNIIHATAQTSVLLKILNDTIEQVHFDIMWLARIHRVVSSFNDYYI
jgi:hypothetical protein